MASQDQIRAALKRASNTITLKPSVGQRVYVSTAVVEAGLACRIQEKTHTMTADLPPSMGGEDTGPSPSALLRAALSSCVAMGVKMWAARRDIDIRRVEARVETDVDARGQFGLCNDIAPGFGGVRINIAIDADAPAETLHEIVDASLRFSPLMDVFVKAQAVTTNVTFAASTPETC